MADGPSASQTFHHQKEVLVLDYKDRRTVAKHLAARLLLFSLTVN